MEKVEESNFLMSFYKKTKPPKLVNLEKGKIKVEYKNKSMDNYLLPIHLMCASTPDFCIVIGQKKKKWVFKTLLNMDEVYTDMRVYGEKYVLEMQKKWNLWPKEYFDVDMVGDNTDANKQVNKSEFVLRGQPIIEINHKKVDELLCNDRTQMFSESSESGEELSECMSRFFSQVLNKPKVRFANKVCLVIEIPVMQKFSSKEIDALTDFMSGFEQRDLDINYGIYYVEGQPNYNLKLLV